MSYSDETVRAKLSALNETQESIVTVAQWIMFHRDHAPQTAQIWLQRVKDIGAPKRLNLIYLANEVVQQSKARKREDFLFAFSPIIAQAASTAYRSATIEVQQKIRRVIGVWRQRDIFEPLVQEDIELHINDIDKARPSKGSILGGSLYTNGTSSSLPPELAFLSSLQTTLSQAHATATTDTQSAQHDYNKLISSTADPPTPPVHAARLSTLFKTLGTAQNAVTTSLAVRNKLIEQLQALVKSNQDAARKEAATISDLAVKWHAIEAKKAQVEDAIMRGLSSEETAAAAAGVGIVNGDSEGADVSNGEVKGEPERPSMEPLTPPAIESFTPPDALQPVANGIDLPDRQPPPMQLDNGRSHTPDGEPPSQSQESLDIQTLTAPPASAPTFAKLPVNDQDPPRDPRRRKASAMPLTGTAASPQAPAAKRRRTSQVQEEYGGFALGGDAMEGLDEEVVGMLG